MAYTLEQQKENRKKWVEALRSGKYKQGRGSLKYRNNYCCLGVLTELAGALFNDFSSGGFEAPEARDFVGLACTGGLYHGGALWRKNDAGASFDEIADIIESEPAGLFVESV